MSGKSGKKNKISKKSILMLIRTSLIAAAALVMVLTVTFAWFKVNTGVEYFQVRVSGFVDANVTFWKLTSMSYAEQIAGQVSEAQLDLDSRQYTQLTAAVPETQATLAPGRGDYFKIQIDVSSADYAYMQVELLDIEWTDIVPEEERPALQEYILLSCFQPTKPTATFKLFTDSVVKDGKRNLTLCSSAVVDGMARNKFFYYFILDRQFESGIAGQLFSVKHVRVTLS